MTSGVFNLRQIFTNYFRFNGEFLNSVIDNSNRMFGTRDIQATRVVYVHGSIDPWHILGLYNSTSTDSPSIFIKGTFIIHFFLIIIYNIHNFSFVI